MALSNTEKRRQAIIQDRRRVLIERNFERQFKREFKRMSAQASQDYSDGGLNRALVGMEIHQENIRAVLERLYILAGKSSERYLKDFFGKSFRIKIERKESLFDIDATELDDPFELATVEMMQIFRRQAFDQSKTIAETSKEGLRVATAQLAETGVGEIVIAKEIRKVLDVKNKFRAATIARTETGIALSESQYAIINDLELPTMVKEWSAVIDGRTRKAHREVDGTIKKKDELFSVDTKKGRDLMRFPQDRKNGSKENLINCRCILLWQPENESN